MGKPFQWKNLVYCALPCLRVCTICFIVLGKQDYKQADTTKADT